MIGQKRLFIFVCFLDFSFRRRLTSSLFLLLLCFCQLATPSYRHISPKWIPTILSFWPHGPPPTVTDGPIILCLFARSVAPDSVLVRSFLCPCRELLYLCHGRGSNNPLAWLSFTFLRIVTTVCSLLRVQLNRS